MDTVSKLLDTASVKRLALEHGFDKVGIVPKRRGGSVTGPYSGTVWQFAVCRYNYSGNLENLELSATAHFTELDFHRYEEYADLIFT